MDGRTNKKVIVKVAVLGLGEAGTIFANDLAAMGVMVSGWDPLPKRTLHKNVRFAASNGDAVQSADIIFSVNLSSVSETVAKEVLPVLTQQKIYLEMNTASPKKKISIDQILKPSKVKFVDLAIMAPVPPKGILTPMLAVGPGAKFFKEAMSPYQLNIEVIEGEVGEAASRKLLRSIVYKGIAAVICEGVEAGKAFGLEAYIREQISSIIGGKDDLIDRFVEGSEMHAGRRMLEMEAVIEMLEEKGIKPFLSKASRNSLEKLKNKRN